MNNLIKKRKDLKRRHNRVRNKVTGTAERPRLVVYRSLRHIYVQLVDDVAGKTLASASTQADCKEQYGGNIEAAKVVGSAIAKKAQDKEITQVVFDRGGRKYHGRIQALAEAAREAGLKF